MLGVWMVLGADKAADLKEARLKAEQELNEPNEKEGWTPGDGTLIKAARSKLVGGEQSGGAEVGEAAAAPEGEAPRYGAEARE
eukprot:4636958-Prymnesium_polylepis.1